MLEKEAKELLALVGGKENVNQLVHCATRLRFELKDESLAQKKEIEAKPYVLSVIISGGQYQIVIGPKVTEYFAALMQLLNLDESKKSNEGKQKISLLKVISGAFSPLIPLLLRYERAMICILLLNDSPEASCGFEKLFVGLSRVDVIHAGSFSVDNSSMAAETSRGVAGTLSTPRTSAMRQSFS